MTTPHILVVDDDPSLLALLKLRLEAAQYAVTLADSSSAARAAHDTYALALVDLRLGAEDGIAVLEHFHQTQPALPVIMMTAHATIASAVEATQKGAYAYLTKPFDHEDLLQRIEEAVAAHPRREDKVQLCSPAYDPAHFAQIIAVSRSMQHVLRQIGQFAATDSTVCLYGESGTGKELIAHALHQSSPRAHAPFVAINCGAIPDELVENELFGHARGAYTGADCFHKGRFQEADGGTLFLDEIGELSLAAQVKLLRVLQERECYPLGATQPIKFNVRLVTATNQDLGQRVVAKQFRADLYYRIHVLPLLLPPLRERPVDIMPLAHFFLQRIALATDKTVQGFTHGTEQQLIGYEWPGNVRELANVVERAVVLTQRPLISPDLLLLGNREPRSAHLAPPTPFGEARTLFERDYLTRVLTLTKGRVSHAAQLAGKDRAEFYRLVKTHALDLQMFRCEALPEVIRC
jgi:two-component system response regulator GlrR